MSQTPQCWAVQRPEHGGQSRRGPKSRGQAGRGGPAALAPHRSWLRPCTRHPSQAVPGEDVGLEQGRQEPQALHSSPAVPHGGSKAGRPVRKG